MEIIFVDGFFLRDFFDLMGLSGSFEERRGLSGERMGSSGERMGLSGERMGLSDGSGERTGFI
jgi:hypothetical protein